MFRPDPLKINPLIMMDTNYCDLNHVTGIPFREAAEKYSTSEPIRIACQLAFEDWQSTYTNKLLESGYSEQQSKDLSIVIIAMVHYQVIL